MGRLTYRVFGEAFLYHGLDAIWKKKLKKDDYGVIQDAVSKLCEYEETSFTSEEVVEMAKELAEYKKLEEQGLLVKLPFKVGDTVYVIDQLCYDCLDQCEDCDENSINWCSKYCPNGYKGIGAMMVTVDRFEVRRNDIYVMTSKCGYRNIENIYLTQEEAEEKMKETETADD